MQSIDSKRNGQHNKDSETYIETDPAFLALFPSLNFNKPNVHAQTKKGMKTLLKVLDKAATAGYVTQYSLTEWKAEPRLGGQVAQNALRTLEEIGLLRVQKGISKKGTHTKEYWLTPKAIIACISLSKYQKEESLTQLIKRTHCNESELGFTLRLYNNSLSNNPFLGRKTTDISPLVTIIKKLNGKGLDLERKSDEDIVKDIRETAENSFLDTLRSTDPLEDMIGMAFAMQSPKMQELLALQSEKDKENMRELFADKATSLEVVKITSEIMRNMLLFVNSPEFFEWTKLYAGNNEKGQFAELQKTVVTRLDKTKLDGIQKMMFYLKVLRAAMREQLMKQTRNSDSKTPAK